MRATIPATSTSASATRRLNSSQTMLVFDSDAGPLRAQLGLPAGGVVHRGGLAEQRHLRLQLVDAVEGAQDRVDEVRVVDAVGDRRGERDADLLERLAVRH